MSTGESVLIRTAKVILPLALMVVAWQAGVLWSQDSKQDFPQPVKAPEGAPNVVVILLDDVENVLEYEQKPFRPFKETTGGTAKLSMNGTVVGSGEVSNVVIGPFSATETLDIGMDLGAVASPAYHDREPFAFTGSIKEVVIEISPTQPLIQK